jgi:hypothetical protein
LVGGGHDQLGVAQQAGIKPGLHLPALSGYLSPDLEEEMKDARMLLSLAAGLLAAPTVGGDVAVVHRGFGLARPEPQTRGYRQGRRFNYGRPTVSLYAASRSKHAIANGDKPAGTKLARKAAKGTLTIAGIQ